MSKQVQIIVGVIVLLVIGAGAFMALSKKPSSSSGTDMLEGSASSTSGTSMVQASIKSLLGAGKNISCDIVYKDDKGSGKIFVADKKFRGDFETVTNSVASKSHMIQDGINVYMWTDDKKEGTKFSMEAMMKIASSPNPQTQQSADLDSNVDMKCSSWTVDNSKLTPPMDVTFQDMTAMMEKVGSMQKQLPTAGSSTSPNSSYCDTIADPQSKAACVGAIAQ